MIFTKEETEKARTYIFDVVIPRVQKHVNETGHIWNLCSTCHGCLFLRQAYLSNIHFIKANKLEEMGYNTDQVFGIISSENIFNNEFIRKLSD